MATHIITHNKTLDELFNQIQTPNQLAELIKNTPFLRTYLDYAVNDNMASFDVVTDVELKREDFHPSQAGAFMISRASASMFTDAILNPKATKNLRRKQYQSMCNMLGLGESLIYEAILKKNLVSVHPTFTHEFICKALDIVDGITDTE